MAHVVIAGTLAALMAAEWLHGGGAVPAWAWGAGVAGAAGVALWARRPRSGAPALVAAVASLVLGLTLVGAVVQVRRIECCWDTLREARIVSASRDLDATLSATKAEARRLAERGATAALLPREQAFAQVEAAIAGGAPLAERGVLITDARGNPWAWAGRHRVLPAIDTTELRATITPFYVTLEARRQTQSGGWAVGTVLLDAAPAAADRTEALSQIFLRRHGVGLKFAPANAPPPGPDVFEYVPEGDTLFFVEAVTPGQGETKLATLARWSDFASVVLVVTLIALLVAAPAGRWRWSLFAVGAWVLARAPLGPWFRMEALFSPATFYRPLLGPFSASAGSLTIVSLVLLIAAGALWRRGVGRRRWWSTALALLLALAAPYLVRYFGRGIAPPAAGVSFAQWLSWQLALATTAMALVLTAAALLRGRDEPTRVPWTIPAAAIWAGGAALAGLWLWRPYGAWPEWYTFLWLPALAGVMVPAPRRWALGGIAVVAGTAAALITWGAALEGRLALAERDALRLGREDDAVAVALLERLGRQVATAEPPRTASELYALWLDSPLAAGDYPTVLALWTPAGDLRAEIRLAALDLPPPLLAALARTGPKPGAGGPGGATGFRIERLERVPGVHYVLVATLASGEVLTVGAGPRTLYVPPDRVARFLRGLPQVEPPYTISLSLPTTEQLSDVVPARFWTRVGWTARGERHLDLPGGNRHVHVRVDLRGPGALLVRGTLVVLLDFAVLFGAWGLGLIAAGAWRPRLANALTALRTSYRVQLSGALTAFFVIPVLAFAVWSFARLGDESRRAGDLLIRQTLRDAAVTAGAVALDRPETLGATIAEMGTRLDAELWLYDQGALAGTSSAILGELGLVDPLLTPLVFRRLTLEDELEVAADARTAGRPTRVGYRVVLAGPEGAQAILAAPQLLDDERVRQQQEDLGLVLVLVTLGGLAAAFALAAVAARGLAEPVAVLRDAALALGRGTTPPVLGGRKSGGGTTPREFEPVVEAFDRMARDVRRSQDALEEARRRTARVLANVATGVIAVDEGLRVTMANPRAAELLGGDAVLEPGDLLPRSTGAEWLPVWNAVGEYLAAGADGIAEREFDVAGRQIRAQLAPLGPAPDGCVIALDDATTLTRAARIIAWGEMARQVAHEIKNPLTPIRLGIQHLQRTRKEGGGGKRAFDATFDETAARILSEIDRLDGIARAFSRFGAPPAEQAPVEPVDLQVVAREVAQLYALGEEGRTVTVDIAGAGDVQTVALARKDEVKEVLVNLLENARHAGARRIAMTIAAAVGERRLTVRDDGRGIPADALPRVFEPTFSTTSSGSGLGLAIAKRLVESWGGTITLESREGVGTTVTLVFQGAPPRR